MRADESWLGLAMLAGKRAAVAFSTATMTISGYGGWNEEDAR